MAHCDLQPNFLDMARELDVIDENGVLKVETSRIQDTIETLNQLVSDRLVGMLKEDGVNVDISNLSMGNFFAIQRDSKKLIVTKAGQKFLNKFFGSRTLVNTPVDDVFHGYDEGLIIEEEVEDEGERFYDPVVYHYDRILAHTELLVNRAQVEIRRMEALLRKPGISADMALRATRRVKELEHRLYGAPDGTPGLLSLLKKVRDSDPNLFNLQSHFEADMKRVAFLLTNRTLENLKEASGIVDFYISIGTFDLNKKHVLFNNSEIYSHGQNLLPPKILRYLGELRSKAEAFKITIESEQRKHVMGMVNADPRVQKMYGRELTAEEVFSSSRGLKDITYVDMMIMDVTNGIFSKGHIIPQTMMIILAETIDKHVKNNNLTNNRIDELKPLVEERLKAMGFAVSAPFVKGVVYNIFRAKDKNGNFLDGLVQRFTHGYLNDFQEERDKFHNGVVELRAQDMPDDARRKQERRLFNNYRRFLKRSNIVMQPHRLRELAEDPEFSHLFTEYDPVGDESHKEELIALLGEKGFQELVEQQKEKLRSYMRQREIVEENMQDLHALPEDTGRVEVLPPSAREYIDTWEAANNPITLAHKFNTAGVPVTDFGFNVFIPRKNFVEVQEVDGRRVEVEGESTGYYDENFAKIEADDVLMEFHQLASQVMQTVHDSLPPDVQEKLGNSYTIPALRKNLTNILLDPEISGMAKISEAFRYILHKFKSLFGERFSDEVSYAHIDPLTGKPEYRVSTSWLKTNKSTIDSRHHVEMVRLSQFISNDLLGRNSVVDLTQMPAEVLYIISESLGCEPTVESIQRRLPTSNVREFNINREIRAGITHHVVQENTFDLPKIMKMYGNLSAIYAARQECLPTLTLMKHYYEQISKTATGARGEETVSGVDKDEFGEMSAVTDGKRVNAIRAMESWFQRGVLGNYNSKNEFGNTALNRERQDEAEDEDPKTTMGRIKRYMGRISKKILSDEEKEFQGKLDEARRITSDKLSKETNGTERRKLERELDYLTRQRNQLGLDVTVTAFFDAIMKFCRLKGLGWNYKSALTNWGEGQLSNMQAAVSGLYFTTSNIYRANAIVRKSSLKLLSGDKVRSKDARKLRALMDRFDILQDSSNDLQKASNKSVLNKASNFAPFELSRRVEYKNQSPIMLAILFDQMITDVNGENPVNVWDAMDENGRLLEEYRTEENVKTWEECTTDTYRQFSTKVTKCIVNTHGDYHELRGMMASEYMSGKALFMFKKWLPRYMYSRFAVEQDDIELGVKGFKGRYRSITGGTLGIAAGLVGFLTMGPVGLLAAGAGGLLVGKFFSPKNELSLLGDLMYSLSGVGKAILRAPLNFVFNKEIIKHETDEQILRKFGRLDADGNVRKDKGFNEMDAKNFRALTAEIAMLCVLVALKMIAKALRDLDDDDEEDRPMVGVYNLAINQLMQMSGQMEAMMSPSAMWESYAAKHSVFEQLSGFGDMLKATSNMMSGNDTILTGDNAGKSGFLVASKRALFPFFSRTEAARTKQFRQNYTDNPSFMWGAFTNDKELRKIQRNTDRMRYRIELADRGFSEKQIEKMVNKKFRERKRA